jgi:drug/metabolite transporter (DMT)-like permease
MLFAGSVYLHPVLSKALKGHIALFIAQVVYALNYSIAKGLMPGFISPMSLVFYRVIGACILFWILAPAFPNEKVERADMFKMAWLALFGVVINQIFFIYGLSLTSPINSSIIMISNPIMVFIFTLIILKERFTFLRLGGLVLAILGALMILQFRGNFETGSDTVAGDLMTFVNATSWAIFIVMVKPIMEKYNTVTSMKWMFLFGSIYMLPIGLGSALETNWEVFNAYAIFAVSFVVIATTFLAYLLNLYGLKSLSSNTVSAYIYLQPFLATLFAILIGEDVLTPTKIVSGILIILGLYLINKKTLAQ